MTPPTAPPTAQAAATAETRAIAETPPAAAGVSDRSSTAAAHGAFQRAAAALVALGACAGWLGAYVRPLEAADLALVVLAGALAWVARGPQPRRWALTLAGLGAAAGLAAFTYPHLLQLLSPAGSAGITALVATVAGALFALITALGLLPRTFLPPRSAVDRAYAEVERALGPQERGLAERALVAHHRVRASAAHHSVEGRRLVATAQALTLEVIDLARRASALAEEIGGVDRAALAARAAALQDTATRTSDERARADFERAARASAGLLDHLRALDDASARLCARLELEVLALEGTALALSTKRASTVVDDAAALAPLTERLGDAAFHLRAEATALAELAS